MTTTHPDPHRSLADVSTLAPVVMAATGLISILQAVGLGGGEAVGWALAAFLVPTIGTTLTAHYLARGRGGWALAAFVGWVTAHALLGLVVGAVGNDSVGELVFCALLVSGITAALALPAFILAYVFGRHRDLEAGDAYLVGAGLWYLALQLFGLQVAGRELAYAVAFGLLAAGVAIVVGTARIVSRHRFARRAARGDLPGWRVRRMSDGDDPAALPPLYGSQQDATAIVERVDVGFTAYRSAAIGMPVARVGGTAARIARAMHAAA